jgi:hypothetical protein
MIKFKFVIFHFIILKYDLVLVFTKISRDVRIWNRKCFISKPILTKEDSAIKTFRRWFSQFYSKSSSTHYLTQNGDGTFGKLEF